MGNLALTCPTSSPAVSSESAVAADSEARSESGSGPAGKMQAGLGDELLARGDSESDQALTFEGCGALHIAATFGHAQMCRLLLKRGADANMLSNEGYSPLLSAARWNQTAAATVLLK